MAPSPGSAAAAQADTDIVERDEPTAEEVLGATADRVGRRYVVAADTLADVARWLAEQAHHNDENEVAHRISNCARVLQGRRL